MNITPEKRNNLIKLGAITAAVLIAFWFLLVRPAQAQMNKKNLASQDFTKKISSKKEVIHKGSLVKTRLDDASRQLARVEEQMVSGDTYLWIIKTLRDFEVPQRLEFTKYDPPQFIQPVAAENLPYKTASFVVNGTAAFHDLGKFLSRFENIYPHIRVNRVDMEPASAGTDPGDKLSFLIEFHVLVKPGATTIATPRP